MKNKKGFISMSLIYSFFIVFVSISISLLAVYSSNISLVRNINKEIKADLTDKGNRNLIVLINLISDGSFENGNWSISGGRIDNEQKYYGTKSLYQGSVSTAVSNKQIYMNSENYYYIQRIYQSQFGTDADGDNSGVFIGSQRVLYHSGRRPCTGWQHNLASPSSTDICGNSVPMERTVENDIFQFAGSSGEYSLSVKTAFTSGFIYTDGYILIDLTSALGKDKVEKNIGTIRNVIDKIIDSEYFEGRKIFTTYQAGL